VEEKTTWKALLQFFRISVGSECCCICYINFLLTRSGSSHGDDNGKVIKAQKSKVKDVWLQAILGSKLASYNPCGSIETSLLI